MRMLTLIGNLLYVVFLSLWLILGLTLITILYMIVLWSSLTATSGFFHALRGRFGIGEHHE